MKLLSKKKSIQDIVVSGSALIATLKTTKTKKKNKAEPTNSQNKLHQDFIFLHPWDQYQPKLHFVEFYRYKNPDAKVWGKIWDYNAWQRKEPKTKEWKKKHENAELDIAAYQLEYGQAEEKGKKKLLW